MELIIIIFIIVSIVAAVNKNKTPNNPGQPGNRPVPPQQRPGNVQGNRQPNIRPNTPQTARTPNMPPNTGAFGRAAQPAPGMAKTPMQEEYERFLKRQAAREALSPEGKPSTEGECIEPNPGHCAVEHHEDAAYSQTQNERIDMDKQELIKGILWSEILGKPKCMR